MSKDQVLQIYIDKMFRLLGSNFSYSHKGRNIGEISFHWSIRTDAAKPQGRSVGIGINEDNIRKAYKSTGKTGVAKIAYHHQKMLLAKMVSLEINNACCKAEEACLLREEVDRFEAEDKIKEISNFVDFENEDFGTGGRNEEK